uniref:protein disulfide-isomerase n=1 Tax=Oryctolagus cuniculus TaxID=9986 RepID=A0A5F9CHJ0_RABIT
MPPSPERRQISNFIFFLELRVTPDAPPRVRRTSKPSNSSPPLETSHMLSCARLLTDPLHCFQGLERTIRDSFGGGNTAWEEEKLSKYKDRWSGSRLVTQGRQLCSHSRGCSPLWPCELGSRLDEFSAMSRLCTGSHPVCCLPTACPGGAERPCGGHGRCDGEGTRGGTGHCDCQAGYGGEACGQCGLGYFEAGRNASHLVCSACFGPCARCSGPEESNCLQCKKGWALHHLKCVDIDECGTERATCAADQFCVNTEGSYECRDCAKACLGCMGAGPGRCKKCSPGYQQVGSKCLDVDECETVVCPGQDERCENTEGGYRCVCAEGYKQVGGLCVKEQVPGDPRAFFSEMTEDELVVLQQMFFGVIICALATLAAKGDLVSSDRVLEGFIKGR